MNVLGLELPVGQRVEVKFDVDSRFARAYGDIVRVEAETGTRIVKLDKVSVPVAFAAGELSPVGRGIEGPRYNPSERCESGMNPWCSCDTCF